MTEEFNTFQYRNAEKEEAAGRPSYRAGATSRVLEQDPQDPAPQPRSGQQKLAIGSCATAMGTLIPIALYQSGAIRHLPDPPGHAFASDRVTTSHHARPLGIPDAYLGLASYAATLALLVSRRRSRGMNIAIHGKLALDGALASYNTFRQIKKGRLCSWCLGTAAATGAMIWFAYQSGKRRREALNA